MGCALGCVIRPMVCLTPVIVFFHQSNLPIIPRPPFLHFRCTHPCLLIYYLDFLSFILLPPRECLVVFRSLSTSKSGLPPYKLPTSSMTLPTQASRRSLRIHSLSSLCCCNVLDYSYWLLYLSHRFHSCNIMAALLFVEGEAGNDSFTDYPRLARQCLLRILLRVWRPLICRSLGRYFPVSRRQDGCFQQTFGSSNFAEFNPSLPRLWTLSSKWRDRYTQGPKEGRPRLALGRVGIDKHIPLTVEELLGSANKVLCAWDLE